MEKGVGWLVGWLPSKFLPSSRLCRKCSQQPAEVLPPADAASARVGDVRYRARRQEEGPAHDTDRDENKLLVNVTLFMSSEEKGCDFMVQRNCGIERY